MGIGPQSLQSGVEASDGGVEWGLLPYGQAEQVFQRIGRGQVPDVTLWRQVEKHGQRFQQSTEIQQAQVNPERVILGEAGQAHDQPQGVSMEGGMVNLRGEGWKEFKVGGVYAIGQRLDATRRQVNRSTCRALRRAPI